MTFRTLCGVFAERLATYGSAELKESVTLIDLNCLVFLNVQFGQSRFREGGVRGVGKGPPGFSTICPRCQSGRRVGIYFVAYEDLHRKFQPRRTTSVIGAEQRQVSDTIRCLGFIKNTV